MIINHQLLILIHPINRIECGIRKQGVRVCVIIKIFCYINTTQSNGAYALTCVRENIESGFPVAFHTVLFQMDRPTAMIQHLKAIIVAGEMCHDLIDLMNIIQCEVGCITIEFHLVGQKHFAIHPYCIDMVAVDGCDHKLLHVTAGHARSGWHHRTAKTGRHMLWIHNSSKRHLHTMIGGHILQRHFIVRNFHLLSVHKHLFYPIALSGSNRHGEVIATNNPVHSHACHCSVGACQHLHRIFIYREICRNIFIFIHFRNDISAWCTHIQAIYQHRIHRIAIIRLDGEGNVVTAKHLFRHRDHRSMLDIAIHNNRIGDL